MTWRRWTTSNQRWNKVLYVNVEIYNVEQRRINVVCFNVDINKVRQRRNSAVMFNVEFHNVDQLQNKIVNMATCKRFKRAKKCYWAFKRKLKKIKLKFNTLNSRFRLLPQNPIGFSPYFKRNIEKNIYKATKVLMRSRKCCITRNIFIPSHFVKHWLAFNQQG